MEVWKIIFLSKWVICRFYVNLPGCNLNSSFHILSFCCWTHQKHIFFYIDLHSGRWTENPVNGDQRVKLGPFRGIWKLKFHRSRELTYPTLGKGRPSTQTCRLVGDILVPRKARASTKKLYVIMSFCTRTFRTLIFPLVLSSTIYVPISLSLLKLQEKTPILQDSHVQIFSCFGEILGEIEWSIDLPWNIMTYDAMMVCDILCETFFALFLNCCLAVKVYIYIHISARFMHISIPTCTKVNMRTFAFHSIWVWSLRVNINDNLGGGFKYFSFLSIPGERFSNLTNIFQMGWTHQPDNGSLSYRFIHPPPFEL